jgi:serine/threonine protein kinase
MDAGDAGRVIGGRYECVELIGRGGMGEVWRARDTLLQRDVAVKRLVYGEGSGDDVTIGRSMREARLAARLNHPNAVAIYDVVVDEGLPCLVMELVNGKSLKESIAEKGRLDPIAAARIGRQVAAALGVAHRAGIVHRDVKPANVLIATDGTAKLTDFGIARDEGDAGLTSTGTFIGTPNFLGPEIALGGNHSPASDVWALGALLYAAVEGEPPFAAGGNALAILNRIATTDAPRPPHGGPLSDVIVETMRRDPGTRPPAAAVVQRLDDVIDGLHDRSSPKLDRAPSGAPPVPRPDRSAGSHTPPPTPTPAPAHTPSPHPTPPPVPAALSYTPPPVTAPPTPSYSQPGPPPPPPPQYGPPSYPGHTPRPRHTKRNWIIAACALVAVAGIVTAVVLATGGKKHQADPTTPTTHDFPTGSTTGLTTGSTGGTETSSTPSGSCEDPRTDGQGPAITYVIFAELADASGAQACVKPGTVPESFTRSLSGKVFTPKFDTSIDDQAPVVKTEFTALDGTKLAVTCTKGADGKYLVTGAKTG